jgi:hypothetical protein
MPMAEILNALEDILGERQGDEKPLAIIPFHVSDCRDGIARRARLRRG